MRPTIFWRIAPGILMMFLTATAAIAQQAAPQPGAEDTEAQIRVLASKLEDLDQQLRVLQRKLEIEKEQAVEKAKATPTVVAGREGFALRSADGDFQLKFR